MTHEKRFLNFLKNIGKDKVTYRYDSTDETYLYDRVEKLKAQGMSGIVFCFPTEEELKKAHKYLITLGCKPEWSRYTENCYQIAVDFNNETS